MGSPVQTPSISSVATNVLRLLGAAENLVDRMIRRPQIPSICLAHLCELDTSPDTLVKLASDVGFDSVGLRLAPAVPGGIAYPLEVPGELEQLEATLLATRLEVASVELVRLSDSKQAHDYAPMFETAARLGARRVIAASDCTSVELAVNRMREVCDLALAFDLHIDLEFMPFRPLASLSDALDVVERADRVNGHILIDALHFHRARASIEDLRRLDPSLIGAFQICDGLLAAPTDLATEAREGRKMPGEGAFDLKLLVANLPARTPVAVEVPTYVSHKGLSQPDRLLQLHRSTRAVLE